MERLLQFEKNWTQQARVMITRQTDFTSRTAFVTTGLNHLIVCVISAHGYRVHDILPTLVLSRGTIWHVIRVMFCPKVVTELMRGHQVCFLLKDRQ